MGRFIQSAKRLELIHPGKNMDYRTAADVVVLLHLAFILFVVLGGVLALKWPKVAWIHIPAAIWGTLIELAGWICPLTPLENAFRIAAGDSGYSGGFIEEYILPLVYPTGLTRTVQFVLAGVVVTINCAVYGFLLHRKIRRRTERA